MSSKQFPVSSAALVEERAHDVAEQLPGDVGIPLDELAKVPGRDLQAMELRLRCHRGGALALGDQPQLAEVVARPQPRGLASIDAHGRLAVRDDEEADAAHRPLLDDRRAGLEAPLPELVGELSQLPLAELAEEFDLLQRLGTARHPRDPTPPAAANVRSARCRTTRSWPAESASCSRTSPAWPSSGCSAGSPFSSA